MDRRQFLKFLSFSLFSLLLPLDLLSNIKTEKKVKPKRFAVDQTLIYNPFHKTETPINSEYLNPFYRNHYTKIHYNTEEKLRNYLVLIDKKAPIIY